MLFLIESLVYISALAVACQQVETAMLQTDKENI